MVVCLFNVADNDESRESISVTISDESIECARLTIAFERELVRPFAAKRDRHLFSAQSMYFEQLRQGPIEVVGYGELWSVCG